MALDVSAAGGDWIVLPKPATLPDEFVGLPYRAKVPRDGATGSTWAVVAGALPDGLNLGAASGDIAGSPRRIGKFDFTLERRASEAAQTTRGDLSIRILAAGGSEARWAGTYEYRFHDRRTYPSGPYSFTVTHTIVVRREP